MYCSLFVQTSTSPSKSTTPYSSPDDDARISGFEIDAVIDPADTRKIILKAYNSYKKGSDSQ